MIPLLFAQQEFFVAGQASLYWPAERALLVADLHLEKASFYARQGQMLPPYDSRATLDDLSQTAAACKARRIYCLGDNYHDGAGEARLEVRAAEQLSALARHYDWLWISGNHDRDVSGLWGGDVLAEWTGHGIALRHEAETGSVLPDISGHYHPKIRVGTRGRHVSRRCFVRNEKHLILPAFGAFTGGLSAFDPAISDAIEGMGEALVPSRHQLARFALPDQRDKPAGEQLDLSFAHG